MRSADENEAGEKVCSVTRGERAHSGRGSRSMGRSMTTMWAVAAVAVLAQTLLALEACAIPVKYDATRSKSSFSAHLGLNETKPTFSTQSVVYDDDVLDMVAYRNPNRWVVKVKGRDRGGSVDCGETIAKICAEAPVPKEGVLFDGECIWEDQMSCFFTLEAASGEADIDALLAQYSDDIEFAERDMKVVMEQQSCSYPFPQSSAPWHLDRIDSTATAAPFDGSFGTPQDLLGENVHVYVLDTGLRTTHVEFAGRVGAGANVLPGGGSNWDDNGHGTAVASVAAGTSNGVCKCCVVHGIKCLDSNGDGSYTDVISGLYWVQRNVQRPAVASMSLSGPTSLGINQAIEELYNGGILTIAAAGNEVRSLPPPFPFPRHCPPSTDSMISFSLLHLLLPLSPPCCSECRRLHQVPGILSVRRDRRSERQEWGGSGHSQRL